jgi:hypothetical protein
MIAMNRILLTGFIFTMLAFSSIAQEASQAVPFTLADRDRIIKLEVEMSGIRNEMNSLRNEMDIRLDAVNSKIDYIFWMLGVMVALIIFILGYMIWDRRTALYPVKEKAESTESKVGSIISVLREYANDKNELANILRTKGLL